FRRRSPGRRRAHASSPAGGLGAPSPAGRATPPGLGARSLEPTFGLSTRSARNGVLAMVLASLALATGCHRASDSTTPESTEGAAEATTIDGSDDAALTYAPTKAADLEPDEPRKRPDKMSVASRDAALSAV